MPSPGRTRLGLAAAGPGTGPAVCGISGVVGASDADEARAVAERMARRLRHRGPDDLVVRTFGEATFGFARLSIIDVATGAQPLASCDGSVAVMVNGEIYNHVELRTELEARGHRFRSRSDAEVVVHLYEELGLGCLERLNGMFGLAIADIRTGELHLARDRVGVKPLYWAVRHNHLTFASELPALLEDPTIGRELDRDGLAELLTLTYLPAPRTPVVGVSKLDAGTVLTWWAGRVRLRRWWSWPEPRAVRASQPDHQLAENVRELLVDAVRLQLRSDVPLGLLLSGGVDSTALLWAAGQLGSTAPGYCVDFDEPEGDAHYARLAASSLGADLQTLPVDASEAQVNLPAVVACLSEPLGDPAVLPSLLVCRAAADHVRVLLSGTGADELWGGYGRYVLPGQDAREVYVGELSVLPELEVRGALGLSSATPVGDRLSGLLGGPTDDADPWAARMYLDGSLSLPGDLLPLLDQTSMAVSIEARVPLLDHRLVELAASVPGTTRIPGGALKGLFRSALRGCVPDAILDREKRGFNPPLHRWAGTAFGTAAERLVTGPGGLTDHLLDGTAVRGWLQPGSASPGLRALRLWTLLVLDLWCRQLVDPGWAVPDSLDDLLDEVA
jgi:asparagine synthase (glutamine-hydrolysing)